MSYLVFASPTFVAFDARSALAKAVATDKRLTKLGLTSVCWLGSLRFNVRFARELNPAQAARVMKIVRDARAVAVA